MRSAFTLTSVQRDALHLALASANTPYAIFEYIVSAEAGSGLLESASRHPKAPRAVVDRMCEILRANNCRFAAALAQAVQAAVAGIDPMPELTAAVVTLADGEVQRYSVLAALVAAFESGGTLNSVPVEAQLRLWSSLTSRRSADALSSVVSAASSGQRMDLVAVGLKEFLVREAPKSSEPYELALRGLPWRHFAISETAWLCEFLRSDATPEIATRILAWLTPLPYSEVPYPELFGDVMTEMSFVPFLTGQLPGEVLRARVASLLQEAIKRSLLGERACEQIIEAANQARRSSKLVVALRAAALERQQQIREARPVLSSEKLQTILGRARATAEVGDWMLKQFPDGWEEFWPQMMLAALALDNDATLEDFITVTVGVGIPTA